MSGGRILGRTRQEINATKIANQLVKALVAIEAEYQGDVMDILRDAEDTLTMHHATVVGAKEVLAVIKHYYNCGPDPEAE